MKKKVIGLVCFEEGKAPFIDKYINLIEENNLDYEIIVWNRNGEKSSPVKNAIIYNKISKRNQSQIFKLPAFIRYARFINSIIAEKKYDRLIILTTMSGFFLSNKILRNYKNRFIFDYRDASYEFLKFFKKRLQYIVENSYHTFVSSKGFLEILPKSEKYVVTHNIKLEDIEMKHTPSIQKDKIPIRINYIGKLREDEYMLSLVNMFSKDTRFLLNIYGGGENYEKLKDIAKECSNVIFHGEYKEEDKVKFITNSDILCYNYPNSYINDYAIANRYYDSIIFKIPLFGTLGTYSGKLITKYELGISLATDDQNSTDKIFDYIQNYDRKKFIACTDKLLDQVITEEMDCINKITHFLLNIGDSEGEGTK